MQRADGALRSTNSPPAEAARLAREQAIGFLARREHSRLELRRKLAMRGHDANVVDRVLADLAGEGLQSDARFAQSYARSSVGRGQGPVKIRGSLRRRGIDAECANRALASALDSDADWPPLANAARVKRFGEAPPNDRAARARQARFLAGRGFPADVIAQVLGDFASP